LAEAEGTATGPRFGVAWWILFTTFLILILQMGPGVIYVVSQGIAPAFDWAGFIGFSLGSAILPLVVGLVGLVWRRRPGLGYCLVAVLTFLTFEVAAIVTMEI